MNEDNKYIRFDWAVKRMLRAKANFGVLEGLVRVLLDEPIQIMKVLECEKKGLQTGSTYNRIDVLCRNNKDESIIIAIQILRELYYLRYKLGVSKEIPIPNYKDSKYDQVKKVYSISILYFDLGQGADYLYHGYTQFVGVHTHDTLKISTKDKSVIKMETPEKIFPEYFLIRVNEFNKVAKTPIEEWLDYIKNGRIREDTKTPGLQEAKRKLQYMKMNKQERQAYDRHINDIMIQNDVLDTAKMEGHEEGRAEGRVEGELNKAKATAKAMLKDGMAPSLVSKYTGLSETELGALK